MASNCAFGLFDRPVMRRPSPFSMRATSSAMMRRSIRPSNALSVQGRVVNSADPCRTLPGMAMVVPPRASHSTPSGWDSFSVVHIARMRSKTICDNRPSGALDAKRSRFVASAMPAIR